MVRTKRVLLSRKVGRSAQLSGRKSLATCSGFGVHTVILTALDTITNSWSSAAGQVAETALKTGNFDAIYTCGPEPMMKKIYDLAMERHCHIQVSLERVFKCGVGICAACVIGPYLVCHDGPVFSEAELSGMPEFGHMRRDLSGKRVPLGAGH